MSISPNTPLNPDANPYVESLDGEQNKEKKVGALQNCVNKIMLWAVEGGHFTTAKAMIELGADVNAQNDIGCTTIYHAVQAENGKLVDYLITKEANVNIYTGYKDAPLFCKCSRL